MFISSFESNQVSVLLEKNTLLMGCEYLKFKITNLDLKLDRGHKLFCNFVSQSFVSKRPNFSLTKKIQAT